MNAPTHPEHLSPVVTWHRDAEGHVVIDSVPDLRPQPQREPEPHCGYCNTPFATWADAWAHEDSAHRMEQRVIAGTFQK